MPNSDRIAVLDTHIGEPLLIRGNPTVEAVREFVREHNGRYHTGQPGGPDGLPAYLVQQAHFHASEFADDAEAEIDISDLL